MFLCGFALGFWLGALWVAFLQERYDYPAYPDTDGKSREPLPHWRRAGP